MTYRLPQPFYFDGGSVGVVLLHAYTGSANDVRMMGRFLEKHQLTVYAPQFAGHATADPTEILTRGSVEAWWADTVTAVEQLSAVNKQPLFVFGLSLGGLFAMRAIEKLPQVYGGGIFSAPVLEGPSAKLTPLFGQYAKTMMQLTSVSSVTQKARLATIDQRLPQQLTSIGIFSRQVVTDLKHIKDKPIFIGQGGQDQIIDSTQAQVLYQQLTQSNIPVDYHWYPQAGHVITVDNAHHQLETDVLEFINRFKK
ncbi:alpha/beta fold hydrolase [Lactobacillus curvatus]|uniref:alpha/beta hydrolase n=1 Tax=Latilactobacillus fragifolii TaxID=2814244 RepID=UPI0012AF918E|nr:alpha/beta fold hydrolase [Latilactobacillus fragifolii]MSD83401.1 alpha/beta fold hydrolase [Latilactobacillus curvatus]MSE23592.1 alpha/beta fold hydrolase [Latilactobacillus curvatus]